MTKVKEEIINLQLSKEEAEKLLALTGACVAGGPMNDIYDALLDSGVESYGYEVKFASDRDRYVYPLTVVEAE